MATRNERVVLSLQDDFSTGMARVAAATALANRNLRDLDGTSVSTSQGVRAVGEESDRTGLVMRRSGADIDKFSGRVRLLGEAALVLGPALAPLGGAGIVAVAGLASQFGALAGGIGVAAVALNGIGDALGSLRDYELEPTEANLEAMQEQFRALDQTGRDFVLLLNSLGPELRQLQDVARAGFLPGLGEGIQSLMSMGPQVEAIVGNLATAMGDLAAASGEALSGARYAGFFDYIETEAGPLLMDFGRTVGNVTETFANLMVAFSPASRDFSSGLADMTDRLAAWSRQLQTDQGFQSFLSYIRENGPAAVDLLGSLVRALAAVVEAAAPLGQSLLPVLTQLADAFAAIASSPIGGPLLTAAAAFVTLNRALTITDSLVGRIQAKGGLSAAVGGLGRSAGGIAAAAAAVTMLGNALADAAGATVKVSDLQRDLEAIANGQTSDLLQRVSADVEMLGFSANNATEPIKELVSGFGLFGDTGLDLAAKNIEQVDQALASMVESGNGEQARQAFEGIAAALVGLPAGASVSDAALAKTMELFGSYATAAGNAETATDGQARAARGSADASREEAQALHAAVTAMEAKRQAALGAFDAETRFRQALVAAREAADRNSAGIRNSSDAALENRSALGQLAAAWNSQSNAVRNSEERFRQARGAFIETAQAMGVPRKAAIDLANDLLAIPKQRVSEVRVDGEDQARGAISRIRSDLANIPDETVNVWVTRRTVGGSPGMGPQEGQYASGGYTGDGGKYEPAGVVHRGEVVIPQEYVKRDWSLLKARYGDLPGFADGGMVGRTAPGGRSLEDLLEVAQITQSIRDMRRSLSAGGQDRLEGLNRKIAQLQLQLAEKELRLAQKREEREKRADLREQRDAIAGIGAGLSFDSLVPREVSFSERMRAELEEFKAQIVEAGGVWDESLQQWATDMGALANDYQATSEAITAETKRRDELTRTLNEQQSQLESLNRTMESYAATVAAQFTSNPFGSRAETVAGGSGPATAALQQAQAQLAAIRSSANGDSIASAAEASRLIAEIDRLQAAADAEAQGSTRTVEGVDFLRETLLGDTANANRMLEALSTLTSKGLDASGAFGGLYQQLAASGDLVTAEQLAALTAEQIDEYEKLFKAREDAAAAVGALATQEVYGQQQEELVGLIEITNAAIVQQEATLVVLNAQLAVLGEQVRAGAASGVAGLQSQLASIQSAISSIPRQQAENDKKRRP